MRHWILQEILADYIRYIVGWLHWEKCESLKKLKVLKTFDVEFLRNADNLPTCFFFILHNYATKLVAFHVSPITDLGLQIEVRSQKPEVRSQNNTKKIEDDCEAPELFSF